MPKQTITDLKEFRNAVETLDKKVRRGLENGNVAEVVNLHWDLVTKLAVATSTAEECVAEKQKKSNIFLFQFLLAYGTARRQNRHHSSEFLKEMRDLLNKEGASNAPEHQDDSTSGRPGEGRKSANRMLNSTRREDAQPLPKKRRGTEKRRCVSSTRASATKTFAELEASEDDNGTFIPSQNPSDPESAEENIKIKAVRQKANRNKTSARQSKEKSVGPGHDERLPVKATKWIHHRRGCRGKGEEIERCSEVDENESITSELEEDRNPKITPRGALTLIKVQSSNLVNSRNRSAERQDAVKATVTPAIAESKVQRAAQDTKESASLTISDKAKTHRQTLERLTENVPQPPARSVPSDTVKKKQPKKNDEAKTPRETSERPNVPPPPDRPILSEKAMGKQPERNVKTWNEWFHEDVSQSSSTRPPPPLPPRPSYIRNWDVESDPEDDVTNCTLSTEDRLTKLEKKCAKIIRKMKKMDDQLTSYDHGFDYITGKLAFFILSLELLDSKFDVLNHFYGEVIERVTVIRREVNAVLHDIYEHSSSEAGDHTHHEPPPTQSSQTHHSENNADSNTADLAKASPPAPISIDQKYVPVHSHNKLAALAKVWSGGSSDRPIDLEEHDSLPLASSNHVKHAEINAEAKLAKPVSSPTRVNAAYLPSHVKPTEHAEVVEHAPSPTRVDAVYLPVQASPSNDVESMDTHLESPNRTNTDTAKVLTNDTSHTEAPLLQANPQAAANEDHAENAERVENTECIENAEVADNTKYVEKAKHVVSNSDAKGKDKGVELQQGDQSSPNVSTPHNSHDDKSRGAIVPYHPVFTVPSVKILTTQAKPPPLSPSLIPLLKIGPDGNLLTHPGPQDDEDDMVEY
uniref:Uncharacterized protein n=1 Tax=Psilocybe cubensis TaxID=181762 RepID=A0A8H8CH88_PSICU